MASNRIAILHCSCNMGDAAAFQDKTYGIGKRVHNPTIKDTYRCTVCGDVKGDGGGDKKGK